jgi:protein-S-isoprenylcysteine O-methyltransferase Ste14
MFVFFRAVVYASFFIGILLIYVPSALVSWSCPICPEEIHASQIVGLVIGTMGAVVGIWCVFTFVFVGKGTPAPFDPPRRLVVRGPYRFVRNPMTLGGFLALIGAALVCRSWRLAGFAALFILATHLFVVWYEEPTLRRTFGAAYDAYCRRVRRWLPWSPRGGG